MTLAKADRVSGTTNEIRLAARYPFAPERLRIPSELRHRQDAWLAERAGEETPHVAAPTAPPEGEVCPNCGEWTDDPADHIPNCPTDEEQEQIRHAGQVFFMAPLRPRRRRRP